jgi:hypothetical protein
VDIDGFTGSHHLARHRQSHPAAGQLQAHGAGSVRDGQLGKLPYCDDGRPPRSTRTREFSAVEIRSPLRTLSLKWRGAEVTARETVVVSLRAVTMPSPSGWATAEEVIGLQAAARATIATAKR